MKFEVVKTMDSDYKRNCSRLDFWFYGRHNEDFIYFEDIFLGLKNQIYLKNLLGATELRVTKSCLWLDKFYPPRSRQSIQNLIVSIDRIHQIQEGKLYTHAACVSNDDTTILIVAYPNVGKTLSTLQFLKEGWKYISDDTVLINNKGYAFLTAFASAIGYKDFLRFINPSDIGWWKFHQKLIMAKIHHLNKAIERVTNPPLLKLADLYPTKKSAKVDVVVTIEIGPKRIKKMSLSEITEKITNINSYSLGRINNPLIWAYSYFNDSFSINKLENKEKANLMSFLENCDNFYSLACNNWNWINMIKAIL